MDQADCFGVCPHCFAWRNNHNFAFEVTWNEVEGKFAITCHDLYAQRRSRSSEEREASSSATPVVAVVGAVEAIAEGVTRFAADAVEANTRNSHDAHGNLAVVLPAAEPSGPTHSAYPPGDSPFGTPPVLPEGAAVWSQALPPASEIAEVRDGCSATAVPAAASNNVSMLDDDDCDDDLEVIELELLDIVSENEDEIITIFKLLGPGEQEQEEEEEEEEEEDLESLVDAEPEEELKLELNSETEVMEEEEAVGAEAQRPSIWTGLFSFQDLRSAHQLLSAVSSDLELCLPVFPEEPTAFSANPARLRGNLDHLCSQLQIYLNYAQEVCGWQILCQVLFREAVDPHQHSENSAPPDGLQHQPQGNLPRDRSIVYLRRPNQGPWCDGNPDSKKDPDSGGSGRGPSGGCAGPSF